MFKFQNMSYMVSANICAFHSTCVVSTLCLFPGAMFKRSLKEHVTINDQLLPLAHNDNIGFAIVHDGRVGSASADVVTRKLRCQGKLDSFVSAVEERKQTGSGSRHRKSDPNRARPMRARLSSMPWNALVSNTSYYSLLIRKRNPVIIMYNVSSGAVSQGNGDNR